MAGKNLFNPVMGSEERVQGLDNSYGSVYFTTDTRRIYLDTNDSRLPMGGNVGLFYGKMDSSKGADDQKEFEFKMSDIIGNENNEILVPNVNDLILNNDGCFYKVLSVEGHGAAAYLNTEKLTIAGSGGGSGPSGGESSLASFSVGAFQVPNKSILQGGSCEVKFLVKVTDDLGDYIVGDVGSYVLEINGQPADRGVVKSIPYGSEGDDLTNFEKDYVNTINMAPFLDIGKYSPYLEIYDQDGIRRVRRQLPTITVSDMELKWDYDNRTLNEWTIAKNFMTLEWTISGSGIQKETYINIDDDPRDYKIGSGTGSNFTYDLDFEEFNLTHGAHTIKMWATARIGIEDIPTDPIYKNIIVAEENNSATIISICLFEKELTQYNTIEIPVYIYNKNNIAGTQTVNLIENSILKTSWMNVENLTEDTSKSIWRYTPTIAGDAIALGVQSGGQESSVTVAIKDIGINLTEKSGYAFKFKASEFSSDTDVEGWNSNGVTATFSEKFDWINGGVNGEDDDEGTGKRQFVTVKAGSTMSINYPLFKVNAPARGKHLKVIFKATNCRDYDAQVLSCKIDKKAIHVDTTVEHFLLSEPIVQLNHAKNIRLNNDETAIEMMDVQSNELNINDKSSRQLFENTYVQFEDGIYQCVFIQVDPENNPDDVYNAWYKVSIIDSFNGILMKAQEASFRTNNEVLTTQYCEDTYIEFEVEVTNQGGPRYIKFWIDGVPCGYTEYSLNDRFTLDDTVITIGSPDCDVYVYLIKLYESDLSVEEHMQNFYADAPNATEMVNRYNRNNIMSDDRADQIDMFKLAKANPNCLVHHYEVPHMPTTKKDKTYPCSYVQYQGSEQAKYYADNVMIKVQGTSSEKYVLAAANLDTDFNYTDNNNVPSGIIDASTQKVLPDGWSMDGGTAIPINFTCTKVNVASCENINNAANQEWYNLFQPYKSVLRCKNPRARDTMQFTNGVIFVTDKNKTTNDKQGLTNNVFSDVIVNGKSYISQPFAKMYSIGQMGNSKDNIHVFHDTTNPLECCVEVADNQMPQQWMVSDLYDHNQNMGEKEKYFEFRYPDGLEEVLERGENGQRMIDGWNDFVSWMAQSNPQPLYNKFENITTEQQFKDIAINKKTFTKNDVYVMNKERTDYLLKDSFDPSYSTYYIKTDNIYGYTDLVLPEYDNNGNPVKRDYGNYQFKGFIAENEKDANGQPWQKNYTPMIKGCIIDTFNFNHYRTTDEKGNYIDDPNNYIANETGYTHDTYEYRMAKMIHECEDHLVMDSVLYHYLFIERHCMIDNVAKNTFWSTEDCQHWNLIKDYDNDTADGTDNQGKFTRNYGMEPTDKLNENAYVFNAHQSVWFNFCHGLEGPLEWMYNKLEAAKIDRDNMQFSVWDKDAYLKYCNKQQKTIPERCWIEDYYRKYFRPNEVYGNTMFNSMLEGGQKTHQRKQYETYQHLYMGSKYQGVNLGQDYLIFRPTGDELSKVKIPVEVYSDCYIYSNVGGQIAKTRAKRNSEAYLRCPVDELGNATMYIHPGSVFTKMGTLKQIEGGGQLGVFAPDQMSFDNGIKLREIIYGTETLTTQNAGLQNGIGFDNTPLLEKVYLSNLTAYNDSLNMESCKSLLELSAINSGFTDVTIADGAPVTTIELQSPTALSLTNLTELQNLDIRDYSKLKTLTLRNIDTNKTNFSKNIISEALVHVNPNNKNSYIDYHITEAKWSIDNANEMRDTTNIILLDKLLDNSYARPSYQSNQIDRYPYSAALTGNVMISKEAYDGSDPLAIYNKYVTDQKFANIDIDFESEKSQLFDVIIYTGDEQIAWQKKTIYGTNLNEDFLSFGPNGTFDVTTIIKSPTPEFDYEFLNSWIVKNEDGEEITTINGEKPIGLNITSDLYIYPNFKAVKRSYTVSIKQKNPITKEIKELVNGVFEYGTDLNTVLMSSGEAFIPYVDDLNNQLGLFEGYDFKGYSAVEDSSILVPEKNYKVMRADTLWAVFDFSKNINTVVHPEWFSIVRLEQNGDGNSDSYTEPNDNFKITGAIIKPITTNMGGKITIPNSVEYEGVIYPVIGIEQFYTGGKTTNVSHVFMEQGKDNKLYIIDDNCFQNHASLKYFDFENCAVRYIGQEAFRNCTHLNANTFGNQLYSVGSTAFNGALDDSISVINIPSSVMLLSSLAIANNLHESVQNRILNIGTEENKSNLLLVSRGNQNGIAKDALRQNNMYHTINFWTSQYSAPNELIEGSTSVATWFATNNVLAPGGTVFVNGINN